MRNSLWAGRSRGPGKPGWSDTPDNLTYPAHLTHLTYLAHQTYLTHPTYPAHLTHPAYSIINGSNTHNDSVMATTS
jgi:hypothetical protein